MKAAGQKATVFRGGELDTRTVRSSALVIVVVYCALEVYGFKSSGFLFGAAWSVANLFLWRHVYSFNSNVQSDNVRLLLAFVVLLKFPVLYGGGYLALKYLELDAAGLLAGFLVPFVVIFLKIMSTLLRMKSKVKSSGGLVSS